VVHPFKRELCAGFKPRAPELLLAGNFREPQHRAQGRMSPSLLRRFFLLSLAALGNISLTTAAFAADSPNLADLRGIDQAGFNQDGSRVVVRGRDGQIGIWEVPAGTLVAGDLAPDAHADAYVLSADGKRLLVGFADGKARVFDTSTAKALSPLLDVALNGQLQMPALFSPDGTSLLVFTQKEALVFNVAEGKRVTAIPLPAGPNEDTPGSAEFTADGGQCFVMDGAATVTRYDPKDWKPIGKPMRHPAAESAYDFEFSISKDGKWLATSDGAGENGPKGNLQVWDAAAGTPLGKPLVAVNGLSARFIGTNRVVILPSRGEAHVRDLPSMKIAYTLRKHDDVDGPRADVSPDRKWVLVWGADRFVDLVDAATGKLADNYAGPATISKVILSPDSSGCYMVFDNSAFVAQGHYDNYVVKLDFPELNLTESLRSLDFIAHVALSPDGKRLLVVQGGSEQERVLVFDAATLKSLK
jgi:WD40 repeat protein